MSVGNTCIPPLPTHKPFLPLQRTNPSVKSVIRSGQTDRQVDHTYHQSLFRSHIVPEISLPEPVGVLGTDRQCPVVHFEGKWLLQSFGKLWLLIVCLCTFMTTYDIYCSKATKSCIKLFNRWRDAFLSLICFNTTAHVVLCDIFFFFFFQALNFL